MSEAFDLHWDRGVELFKEGKKAEASTEWREASRRATNDAQASASLAHALSILGYSVEALAAVRAAIRFSPTDASLYSQLGYHLGVEADKTKNKPGWEAAGAAFQQAIDIGPTDSHGLHSLGVLKWRLGKKREAIAALKAAVAIDPNNAAAHLQLWEYQGRRWDIPGMVRTINAMNQLPASEEMEQHYAQMSREWPRVRGILLTGAVLLGVGIATLLIWMLLIWRRRRG